MKTARILKTVLLVAVVSWVLLSVAAAAPTVKIAALSFKPTLDGDAKEWGAVPEVSIPVTGDLKVRKVGIRGGTHGDEVYFLIQWEDDTEDRQHRPFIWNAKTNKYDGGKQSEDRLALQFAIDGQYSADWMAGNAFTADMWHWKAARSNPAGLVHDKMTIISLEPLAKAYKATAKNGKTIYIRRPSDKGDKLYKTARYARKEQDVMPKYLLAKNPKGSISDIKARGEWKNGVWTLELRRKMNTGNDDDAVFVPGKPVKGGIAVFDRSGDDKHNVSETVTFQF